MLYGTCIYNKSKPEMDDKNLSDEKEAYQQAPITTITTTS